MESMSWVTLNLIDSSDAMSGGGPPRFLGSVGGCAWLGWVGWVAMARSGQVEGGIKKIVVSSTARYAGNATA